MFDLGSSEPSLKVTRSLTIKSLLITITEGNENTIIGVGTFLICFKMNQVPMINAICPHTIISK